MCPQCDGVADDCSCDDAGPFSGDPHRHMGFIEKTNADVAIPGIDDAIDDALLAPWAAAGIAIPGIDCTLGERVGSEDFDYNPPRCRCGCSLVYDDDGFGWLCPHCEDGP